MLISTFVFFFFNDTATTEIYTLSLHDALPICFVYPLFVCPGSRVKDEIASMPGNFRWSVDLVAEECKSASDLGIPAVLLFGIPEKKDETGSGAYDPDEIGRASCRGKSVDLGGRRIIKK